MQLIAPFITFGEPGKLLIRCFLSSHQSPALSLVYTTVDPTSGVANPALRIDQRDAAFEQAR